MPTLPGFSQGAINIIKSKVSQIGEQERLVTLCMDEISLKTHLYYDISADNIVGLEGYGSVCRTNKVATSGLVFLVRSITGGWKQALGYPLVNGACPADAMEMLIREAIDIVTGQIKCLQGWLVAQLNAILQIWEHLKTMHDFKFLLTRRLNSDPIENLFRAIRQQGGNSDNPTPVKFTRAFRKLFFSSFLEFSTGNCDQDLDTVIGQFSKDKSNMPVLVSPKAEQPNTLDIGATD